ncbi:helix-turn-helix transcriptional regulator [Limosilactobacillus sp. c11Ua_112_M]|jgi:hypothetical protein|uniref:helix-turn-helix domain-containing protein n=1 Tax=Limosilactobacillus TaxID=2742598 RepID=UPI00178417F6|nr:MULTISPECIES: helix-turn-helix transcriptional regulator [Limosilactobacillus]MBD8088299.1 helix-turn-helix transcriptional regulator [Limosilactobacillus portuensis]MEC4742833.1 helix-turn-helix transcriptional regulator [Limosilactobacillus sp. c10Ua_36]
MNKIGINVASRRHELGMIQEKLAELSDLSINFISKVERGAATDIKAGTLQSLAKALNVSMDELMNGKVKKQQAGPFQQQLIKQLNSYDLQYSETLCQSILNLLNNQQNKR